MIDSKERARRDEAHAAASFAWSYRRGSRTAGLGDVVRSIGRSAPTPPEVRALRQQHHKQTLRRRAIAARAWSDKHNP